ncbi:hypothetical protein HK100_011437 [Physocladia obscura]|uniref:Serine hydrolase domain-containing protein n=1 Tax=Physocladia obscura TaxID=109957 RepID=A0AAD5T1A0_9FUNG|nr:hypothetical protein HK100_011437 [Physocladia obscura]
MQFQTEGLRRELSRALGGDSKVELVFVDGVFAARGDPDSDVLEFFGREAGPFYEWTDGTPAGARDGDTAFMEPACRAVLRVLADEGPFDALCGFSQGAAVAALVVASLSRSSFTDARPLPVVLVCGAGLSNPSPTIPPPPPINVPSIHIVGIHDHVYPRSIYLRSLFVPHENYLFEFNGAHHFPSSYSDPIYNNISQAIIRICNHNLQSEQ